MSYKPSFQPLYQQVKDTLLKRIAAGDWPPGTFLPSEYALAKEYGVSQGTLRKALNELTSEGRVVRYQGKGTAVPTFDADQHLYRFFKIVNKQGRHELPVSQILSARVEKASKEVEVFLKLEKGDKVFRLERIRVLEGVAVINERIYMPCACFPGIESYGANTLPNTLYDFFQKKFQITIVQIFEDLKAVAADATDSKRLEVPVGYPLLSIRRIALDLEDRPVELRLSRCNTSEHSYHIQLR
ncbi:MAG: GntR family transcriptional regulator [Desulfovibrio sp.]|nr:GntR family transcriptional regulator [Desulfovibrio sp.]MBI4961177.1 GntR family transcriptional regulator [Desulfovibrio sp.]